MSDDGRDWGQWRASNHVLRDLPVAFNLEFMDLLKQEHLRLHACLIPIKRKVAAVYLAKLRTRYPERATPMVALKMIVHEDLDDIEGYPEQLVEHACKTWRNNPDNEWAPKSVGQLMDCIKYEFKTMKTEFHRIGILLALPSR